MSMPIIMLFVVMAICFIIRMPVSFSIEEVMATSNSKLVIVVLSELSRRETIFGLTNAPFSFAKYLDSATPFTIEFIVF